LSLEFVITIFLNKRLIFLISLNFPFFVLANADHNTGDDQNTKNCQQDGQNHTRVTALHVIVTFERPLSEVPLCRGSVPFIRPDKHSIAQETLTPGT